MLEREPRDLGFLLEDQVQNPDDDTSNTNNDNQTHAIATATRATQVIPLHGVIDLTSSEGKKLHQKATQGLPTDQKRDGGPKDTIKFVERV